MFERLTSMEKQLYDQDLLINTLTMKINEMETSLSFNVKTIEKLVDKVQTAEVRN